MLKTPYAREEQKIIRKLLESAGATIGIKVSGKIYLEQENQWIEMFNKLREEYEQINILVVLDGKINFGVDIAHQNLKWVFKHFNKHQ